MLLVRNLMTPDVFTVGPELSLRDAIGEFSARHVSGAPVVVDGRVVGVLSTSDVLGFQTDTPAVPTERPSLEEGQEAVEWVEGEEPPTAFFSEQWSDAGADVVERFAQVAGPEWDLLAEHTGCSEDDDGLTNTRTTISTSNRVPCASSEAAATAAGVSAFRAIWRDRTPPIPSSCRAPAC